MKKRSVTVISVLVQEMNALFSSWFVSLTKQVIESMVFIWRFLSRREKSEDGYSGNPQTKKRWRSRPHQRSRLPVMVVALPLHRRTTSLQRRRLRNESMRLRWQWPLPRLQWPLRKRRWRWLGWLGLLIMLEETMLPLSFRPLLEGIW